MIWHCGPDTHSASAATLRAVGKSTQTQQCTNIMHNVWNLRLWLFCKKCIKSDISINGPVSILPVTLESVDMVLTGLECYTLKCKSIAGNLLSVASNDMTAMYPMSRSKYSGHTAKYICNGVTVKEWHSKWASPHNISIGFYIID